MWLFLRVFGFCLSRSNRIGIEEQDLGKETVSYFFYLYLTRDGPFTAAQGRYSPAYYGATRKKKVSRRQGIGGRGRGDGQVMIIPFL